MRRRHAITRVCLDQCIFGGEERSVSIPRDHHYLPQFYTARWATDGTVVRYSRPGPTAALYRRKAAPKAVGWSRDLYAYSQGATEEERQRLELKLFSPIDHRGGEALLKLDAGEPGSAIDKVGLVQLVLSLQHRSPSRIAHMRNDLIERMADVRSFDADNPRHRSMVADQINDLLLELIYSESIVGAVAKMKVFRIDVESKHSLLTCDLPLMMSNGIVQPQGFLMFPYSPKRVAILAHDARVAEAFSSQEPNVLAKSLNDAVVRQAREIVIAAEVHSKRFVDNRFLKNSEPITGDGMMRWEVP